MKKQKYAYFLVNLTRQKVLEDQLLAEPDEYSMLLTKATAYRKMERVPEALQFIERAEQSMKVHIDFDCSVGHSDLEHQVVLKFIKSQLLTNMTQYSDAIEALKEGLQLDPRNPKLTIGTEKVGA